MSSIPSEVSKYMGNAVKLADIWGGILYNVKAYGAKGDGVTDDTAAIQATINYAISVGGKAVFFPHGTYKVTSLSSISSVVLFGDNASFIGISNSISQIGNPTTGNVYNVKDYGAIGDGIVDDTATIISTMTKAAVTGGIVFFPPGTYIVSSRLTLPSSDLILEGVGTKSILKSKASTFAPDTMITAANKSNIIIRNLQFQGNGSLPSGQAGSANAAFFFQTCDNVIIEEIYMTNFMGIGIVFSNSTDCKVERCKFIAMGQNVHGLTPFTSVPAVYSGATSKDIKVINNTFKDCRFSGVFHFSDGGLISDNTFEHIGESAIYTEYSVSNPTKNTIITRNRINDCYVIDISATGIECSSNNVIITDNIISRCEGNGIGIGASSNVTASNNICFNNNQNPAGGLNGAGVLLQNIVGAPNPDTGKNIIIANNNCYDDQAVPTQKYGVFVSVTGGTSPFLRSIIEGNTGTGNTSADLYINPAVFNDPSNIIRNNYAWPDIQKDVTTSTLSTVTTSTLKTINVPAGSMLQNGGIRIKAYGTVTGTAGAKTIRVKHNNGFGFATVAFTAAQNGYWSIDATIYNVNATNAQTRDRKGFANTALQDYGIDTTTIDTTVVQSVLLQATLASTPDTIICNFMSVERV